MDKVGSTTGSKNSVFAFLICMAASVLAFLKCMGGSVLVSLTCTDGSALAHFRFSIHCPHYISTVGEVRCTIAIIQEKHQHALFEIECLSGGKASVSELISRSLGCMENISGYTRSVKYI